MGNSFKSIAKSRNEIPTKLNVGSYGGITSRAENTMPLNFTRTGLSTSRNTNTIYKQPANG